MLINALDHHAVLGSNCSFDIGPGFRVYYSQRGTRLLFLLVGGDKSSQSKDIQLAIKLAKNFKE